MRLHFVISAKAFKWTRAFSVLLSIIWALIFGYLEADALNYTGLAQSIFGHFTMENIMLLCIATIVGFLPFAAAIRFGEPKLARKSVISVFQIVCLSILVEDIAYFVYLGQPILPSDWTAQMLGGFYLPLIGLFVPCWYFLAMGLIALSQYAISRT